MDSLKHLADLIIQRNINEQEITALIGRPATIGYIGEYIASKMFNILLVESASQKSIDGHFMDAPFIGRTVNIKWYAKLEWILDITPEALPDFYFVLAGPRSEMTTSRGSARPWLIESVYLFDAHELISVLLAEKVKIGIATSIKQSLWRSAEVYPKSNNTQLVLSDEQRRLLGLFG